MDVTFVFIIALIVFLFFLSGYLNEKKAKREFVKKLRENFGAENTRKYTSKELLAISRYHFYVKGDYQIDDITWNDLDMWSVYKQLNFCQSSAGDELLYHCLRQPKLSYNWDDFEQKIKQLSEDEEQRIALMIKLHDIGRSGKYSIFDYLDKLESIREFSVIFDIILLLLYIPAIALCFFNGLLGAGSIVLLVIINITTYFKRKSKIEPFIACFEYILKVLKNASNIVGIDSSIFALETSELKKQLAKFDRFKRFSTLVIGNLGNGPIGVLLDYLKMFTHADLIRFRSMLAQILDNKDCVIEILQIIGSIDMCISTNEYRQYLGSFCIPQNSTAESLTITECYHPLITNPVCNSISLDNGIIITGSNASGKSTFLKTVALNILLAQSIHTVCASGYAGPNYLLYTSLNLKDSISTGDSYYMAEIKAIRRIIDAAKSNIRVIGFVDEVLRGTNTIERIAASSAILHSLLESKVVVVAATHDLELTKILEDNFTNYHFGEEMNGDDVTFPYKLLEGIATTTNAIRLLGQLGFDDKITSKANEMVRSYEINGRWTKINS